MHTSSNASRRLVINNNTAAFYRTPSAYKHYYYSLVFGREATTAATIAFLHFLAFTTALHTLIVECHCGSNERSQRDGTGWLKSLETTDPVDTTDKAGGSVAEMYGASGIPELIPPSGPPRQAGPAGQYNPGHPQVNGHGGEANPQRLGQRAPKLGQIGRSKKVDLEDEDLEDIMNNNGQCQVSLAPCS